jgi:hypothetical protein
VFENRVLRRIFRPKRDEVTGGWRKLHSVELYNLYSTPNIIKIIKLVRMRWAGHVARRRWEMRTEFWLESPKGSSNLEDLGENGRIGLILKRIFGK